MSAETQSSDNVEELNQGGSEAGQTADLMAEFRKAQMRAEAYSHLDDPYGANREAQEENRRRAEELQRQLAGQQPDEQSEAA